MVNKSLMIEELLQETYLPGTRMLLKHHLINICGLMKVLNSILIVMVVIGMQKDMILESTTSSLLMDLTGKSKTWESKTTGPLKINVTQLETTKLKEIQDYACTATKTKLMPASIKLSSIFHKEEHNPSLLVWEILNPQGTSGPVITASPTDSPSMEEIGLMTLQL